MPEPLHACGFLPGTDTIGAPLVLMHGYSAFSPKMRRVAKTERLAAAHEFLALAERLRALDGRSDRQGDDSCFKLCLATAPFPNLSGAC
jgi:hypothetical protein